MLTHNSPIMQTVDILQRSPLFSGLERSALKTMAGALSSSHWPANSEILTADETARRFMVIARGRVKITCSNRNDGRELTLWLLGPGDAFDIVSLLDGERHGVSAWTLDDAEVLSAPMRVFRQWIERYPAFRVSAHRYTAQRLREVTQLAGDLALHDTMTRLAYLLLRHFDGPKGASQAKINLIRDLSHEELAHLIGSVRVVVSRLLGRLKRDGIVDLHGGTLRVLNLKRLLRVAEGQVGTAVARPKGAGRAEG